MAEAIGLAASILAIESAAEAILTVAKWMFRTAKEISGVEEDIEAFAKKIDSFQSIIGAAYFALYIHYMDRDQESLSALMKDIVKRDTLRKLVAGSHMVLHQIKNLKPRIKIMRDQLSMFNKLKWLFLKKVLDNLGPEMECLKTSMNLLLSLINFDVARSREQQSRAVRKELKRLRRQIRDQAKQLAVQKEELSQRQQSSSDKRGDPFIDSGFDFQDDLLNFCDTMINSGIVPISPASNSSAVSTLENGESSSPMPSLQRTVSSTDPNLRHLRHARSPITRHSTQRSVILPTYRLQSFTPDVELYRQENEVEEYHDNIKPKVIHPPPVTELARRPTPALLAIDEDTGGPLSAQNIIVASTDESNISVQHQALHSNPNIDILSVLGTIETLAGRSSVTALVDSSLPRNVVSRAFVLSHGLEIEPLDGDQDDILVDIGNAKKSKSSEQVIMQWGNSRGSHRKPFSVKCFVYPDGVRGLTFGVPFIEEVNRSWDGWWESVVS